MWYRLSGLGVLLGCRAKGIYEQKLLSKIIYRIFSPREVILRFRQI